MKEHTLTMGIAGILLTVMLVSGCRFLETTDIGETRIDSQTVELGSANDVDV